VAFWNTPLKAEDIKRLATGTTPLELAGIDKKRSKTSKTPRSDLMLYYDSLVPDSSG
jgi:hypothetical protein